MPAPPKFTIVVRNNLATIEEYVVESMVASGDEQLGSATFAGCSDAEALGMALMYMRGMELLESGVLLNIVV